MKSTVLCLAALLLAGAAVSSAHAGSFKCWCCAFRANHGFGHGSSAPTDLPSNFPPPPNPFPINPQNLNLNGDGNGNGEMGFPFPMHQFARSPRDYFMLENWP
jgi:hypothetical protein